MNASRNTVKKKKKKKEKTASKRDKKNTDFKTLKCFMRKKIPSTCLLDLNNTHNVFL